MNSNERREQLIQIIQEAKSIDVNHLMDQFSVTPATIRRDLSYLEANGIIKRSHGMAHITKQSYPQYAIRSNLFPEEKTRIAKKAASLISEGESIILDAGTTTLALAAQISTMVQLHIITNSPMIACELFSSPSTVIVSGGSLLKPQLSLVGPDTDAFFNQIEANKMFLGVGGIRSIQGLTSSSPIEGQTKNSMMKAAKEVYALIDSSKFSNSGIIMFAEFKDIDYIITDKPIENDALNKQLLKLGVEVIIA